MVVLLFTISILLFVIMGLFSLFQGRLIDSISESREDFLKNILYLGIIIVISSLLYYFMNKLTMKVAVKGSFLIRDDVFQNVINKDYLDFTKKNKSEYSSLLLNDVRQLESNYLNPMLMLAGGITSVVVSTVLMIYSNFVLGLIIIGITIVLFFLPLFVSGIMMRLQREYSDQVSQYTSTINNLFDNYLTTATKGITGYVIKRYQKTNLNLFKSHQQLGNKKSLVETIGQISHFLITAIAVIVSAIFVFDNKISIGDLTVFVALTGTFTSSLSLIFQIVPVVKSMSPIIEKINFFSEVKANETNQLFTIESAIHSIKADRLSLNIGNKNVLNEISFDINHGDKVIFTGPNGGGKTMLSYIIMGLLRDYSGSIKINNQELNYIKQESLSKTISYIQQNPILFDGSIKDNLTLDNSISNDVLLQTINFVGLTEWFSNQHDGLDSIINNDNIKMSGGEKQRLFIARSILENKDIIILDEPDSAVDIIGRQWLMDFITKTDKTIIMISHNIKVYDLNIFNKSFFVGEEIL
ncbi:MAG: ABC transporter ATP-binding protein [Acholeplasmataceae bacterium]